MSLNTNKEIEKKTQTNSKSKQLSIHIALLVTTLSFCLIPLILITTVLIGRTQQISKENFISTGSGLNQISMGFLNDTVNEYMATLESIVAHNDFTETNDPGYNQLKTNFIAHRDSNTSLFNVYFVGNDGTFIQTLDEELPDDLVLTELTWFKNSIAEGGKITVSSPYADVLTDTIAFSMYKAVEKNGQIIGVLALDINLSILAKELETIRYGGEGKLIVTDSKGSVLISPDHELLNTTVPTEYSSWDEVSTNTSGVTYYEYNDIAYTALYDTYELTGWKFIFMIPTQTLNTISSMTKLISIGIMILVSLICITVNTFIARRVRKSFGSMTSHIETIANGNFNTPLQLVSFISDFSFLTDHLNTMQESVGSLLKNFNQSIENVTYHTNASLEESKTVASSIDQINETMKEISEGTNESSSNLENISFHMDSLSENMNHLKVATDNVTTMATKTSSLGQSGNDISEVVRQTSAQTKISTLEVKEAIDEVSQKIDAIRLMSTTITSITEQTNLLALNATIEAARAGEAGKGFAVVASEISKLADETSSSAQKINDVVQTIEHFVSKAVEKVSETTETVNSQEKAIMQSQVIFTDIIESVHNLSEKVAEINTELANVNHMKDNVLEQVESLSSILEETAAGTEEITNSVATVQTSTDHFVDNLSQLSSMASDLTQHINNFKF